jgi:hypothetical protein
LRKNRYDDHKEENGGIWIERESRILEILIKENDYNRYASSHINNDRVGISIVSVTGTILPK